MAAAAALGKCILQPQQQPEKTVPFPKHFLWAKDYGEVMALKRITCEALASTSNRDIQNSDNSWAVTHYKAAISNTKHFFKRRLIK